jgi:hypothetical protein
MTRQLVIALLFMVGSVLLLRQGLGRTWLRRPFVLMILAACVYHGVSELLLLDDSIAHADILRLFVPAFWAHTGAMVVSFGMFAASVAYLVGLKAKGRDGVTDLSSVKAALRLLDWRLLALAAVPLALVTYQGGGYATGRVLDARHESTLTMLAAQFFVAVVVMGTYSFVASHGPRWFVAALVVQCLVLALAGQRLELVIAAVSVCACLATFVQAPTRRQMLGVALVGGLLAVSITGVRVAQGRGVFQSNTGITERLTALAGGLPSGGRQQESSNSIVQRLDSNEWAGGVIRSIESGTPPEGLGAVLDSLRIVVPSALDPGKNDRLVQERSTKAEQVWRFALVPTDHLPGHFGLWIGLVGPLQFPFVMAVFGWLFAKVEWWSMQKATAARMITLVLLLLGALFYERGIPTLLLFLRFAIPLGLLASVAQRPSPLLASLNQYRTPRLVSLRAVKPINRRFRLGLLRLLKKSP